MAAIQKPTLALSHLTKTYGKNRGINDISLSVMPGEVFGFIGPNGAGKSTTISILMGHVQATAGQAQLFGFDSWRNAKAIHQRVGFLAGDMTTDPSLTGKQCLTYVAHLRGVDPQTVEQLTGRLQCDTSKKIRHLSRGNKQKIGLVAALMHDPELLILDEPTSGLDPLMQAEFNNIIKERKAHGKTTFMSSHVLSEVQETCDRVGFIRNGELVAISSLRDLFSNTPRQVSIQFETDPNLHLLRKLAGVNHLKTQHNAATFLFDGEVNQLLKELSRLHLTDIQIVEPDLEELFMNYYSQKEASHV